MELLRVRDTKSLSRDEWLEVRRNGIGGSDAAAILGLNRFKGAFSVYADKVLGHHDDLSNIEAVYWGNVLEDIVAKEFVRRTGKKAEKVNAVLRHPEYEFIIADLDRRIVGENAVLECKTTNAFNEKEWLKDEVPAAYLCQIQHYMAVTGADVCYIACLIGGQKFIYKTVLRDDDFIDYLIEREVNFWENNIRKEIPPEIDGSRSAERFLKETYPESMDTCICMTSDIEAACRERRDLKNKIREHENRIKVLDNRIKLAIGENSYAQGRKFSASWVSAKPRRILNTEKLAADYQIENLDKYYVYSGPNRQLRIKEVK